MAYAMTKQGSLDNCITYEFICDTISDMNAIENRYRTIGTVAIVLKGENEGLEVYITGSDKQWNNLTSMGTSGGSSSGEGGSLSIHICGLDEVTDGLPNTAEPDANTIYLVPGVDETNDMYEEYIYVNDAWEKFGAGSLNIDFSAYATKANPEFTGTIKVNGGTTPGTNAIAIGSGTYAQASNSIAILGGNVTPAATNAIAIQNATAKGTSSFAIGGGSTAEGNFSFAQGNGTYAKAQGAHAEGNSTNAKGEYSHSEGNSSQANGNFSHAEGQATIANGAYSHVLGQYNIADDYSSWSEWVSGTSYTVGQKVKVTTTVDNVTSVKGYICKTTNSDVSFTESKWNEDYKMNYIEIVGNGTSSYRNNARTLDWSGNEKIAGSLIVGYGTATGSNAISLGSGTASGYGSLALSSGTASGSGAIASSGTASGSKSMAIGPATNASNEGATATGINTTASGRAAHAEGLLSEASAEAAHAEGYHTVASAIYAHAEGYYTTASQNYAHAEGQSTTASGSGAHAEGYSTHAIGGHAEGSNTWAEGSITHAEGYNTHAVGSYSHVEGQYSYSNGMTSHAEGEHTQANGSCSHVEGYYTIADGAYQHVTGQYNVSDGYGTWNEWEANQTYAVGDRVKVTKTNSNNITTVSGYICKTANTDSTFNYSHWTGQGGKTDYLEIVGNGTSDFARSNARALDWDGNEHLKGDLYVGCNADSTGGTKVATIADIDPIENISGSTPSITGVANTRYICSEVSTLSITPPQTGIIDVRFDSGTTPTVLTVPNTVKFPVWFDKNNLEANTTYEINITDGVYAAVMLWQ